MRLRRHFDHGDSTGIDLAPMLDFVLNLLIFFIITAIFSTPGLESTSFVSAAAFATEGLPPISQ